MKYSILVLFCSLVMVCAKDEPSRFKSDCPFCQTTQIERALSVRSTGSYTTNGGNFVTREAQFRCINKKCKKKYSVPANPVFVPTPRPAVEIKPGEAKVISEPPGLPAKLNQNGSPKFVNQ